MFSLHFNLCNPAINNRGVSVGKWKLFARSREDIADIRNYHAGNYCIPVFTSCILMQRNFFPEIFFEFSLGHAVKPVTAHLTTFIIISMFIRVNTKKIQIFTKEQEFTANPNQNLPSRHFLLGIGSGQVFSPERLARWSVATRPPYEKCLSKFVELGGGVRCCLATLMKAFLRLSLGKYANQGCVPSTFSKWIHHGLVGGLPAMVVVRRVCLLAFLCQLG